MIDGYRAEPSSNDKRFSPIKKCTHPVAVYYKGSPPLLKFAFSIASRLLNGSRRLALFCPVATTINIPKTGVKSEKKSTPSRLQNPSSCDFSCIPHYLCRRPWKQLSGALFALNVRERKHLRSPSQEEDGINIPRNRASIYLDNRNPVHALMVRVSETAFTSRLDAIGSSLGARETPHCVLWPIHRNKHT